MELVPHLYRDLGRNRPKCDKQGRWAWQSSTRFSSDYHKNIGQRNIIKEEQ